MTGEPVPVEKPEVVVEPDVTVPDVTVPEDGVGVEEAVGAVGVACVSDVTGAGKVWTAACVVSVVVSVVAVVGDSCFTSVVNSFAGTITSACAEKEVPATITVASIPVRKPFIFFVLIKLVFTVLLCKVTRLHAQADLASFVYIKYLNGYGIADIYHILNLLNTAVR